MKARENKPTNPKPRVARPKVAAAPQGRSSSARARPVPAAKRQPAVAARSSGTLRPLWMVLVSLFGVDVALLLVVILR
jgi:hypothetical protein